MLKARPNRLVAAAAALDAPKGELRPSGTALQEQRSRLLQIPIDKLTQFRINPRALDILPTLAVEVHNAPLRARVIALATAQVDDMSWPTLARLLPWLYDVGELRKAARSRARREPPAPPLPRWLVLHWQDVLTRDDPAGSMAAAAVQREPVLARLPRALQLPHGAPLARDTLLAVLKQGDGRWLDSQPYTETLRFIEHSGAAAAVRIALARRVLRRYGGGIRATDDLSEALEELYAVVLQLFQGGPSLRPGMWHGTPPGIRRAARWASRLVALRETFPDHRVQAWRRWLRRIDRIDRVRDIVGGVWIAGTVFAEPLEDASVCRIYTPETWMQFMDDQAASVAPIRPPKTDQRVKLPGGDPAELDNWIQARMGLRP
ncbi:MAG: hypothetical protein AAFV53_06805 [Myxococcota bacterium]